jgi:hypothetical protein
VKLIVGLPLRIRMVCNLCSYPEAQLPLAVPPLLVHSLAVKHVPLRKALKVKVKMQKMQSSNFLEFSSHIYRNEHVSSVFIHKSLPRTWNAEIDGKNFCLASGKGCVVLIFPLLLHFMSQELPFIFAYKSIWTFFGQKMTKFF